MHCVHMHTKLKAIFFLLFCVCVRVWSAVPVELFCRLLAAGACKCAGQKGVRSDAFHGMQAGRERAHCL